MQNDSLSVLPEGVLPAGLKADPVAHRRASQPRLAVPHELADGVQIVLAGAVSAEMGDDGVDRDRPLQPVGGAEQQELGPASGF